MSFTGKVAVVTGGASGIGLATCVEFAKLGCKVVVNDYSEDSKEKAIGDILEASKCGVDALFFVQGDVSKEEDVAGLIEKAVSAFGKLDFLVNNAGRLYKPGPIEDIPSEEFADMMHVNCFGTFYGLKHGIKQMKSQPVDQGPYYIVNMASIAGISAIPTCAGYGATKHAIVGLSRTAAKEVFPAGIRVNTVCPGLVETPMALSFSTEEEIVEMKPLFMQPKEIAQAVIHACSAPYMSGHQLVVDGSYTGY